MTYTPGGSVDTNKVDNSLRLEECQACGYSAKWLYKYPSRRTITEEKLLCELCANTLAGRTVDGDYCEHEPVLDAISYVGNVILERLEELCKRSG